MSDRAIFDAGPERTLMVDSLGIRNFKCFENLELHSLRRINILVGENSSGKSALLEGIFLAAGGSPELVLRLRAWRGLGQPLQVSVDRSSYESLWKDLFFGFDQEKTVLIDLVGSPSNTRSLSISYKRQGNLTLPIGSSIDSPIIAPIVFDWKDQAGISSAVEPTFGPNGLNLGSLIPTMPAAFFSVSYVSWSPSETASRFSELSKRNQHHAVVEALQKEFPQIKELSVEVSTGSPAIYALVDSLKEKIPVGMISSGINKFLTLLLAIATIPKGVVLVDEIENGFYFERLPQMWRAIAQFCKEYDTQIFASTHSYECLSAAVPTVISAEQDFSLIRMSRENGRCTASVIPGLQFERAVQQEIEVR